MVGLGRRSPLRTTRAIPAWRSYAYLLAGVLLAAVAAAAEDRPPYVSPAEVKEWLDQGRPITFLDVREADEFAAGHLPAAKNVVYDQVQTLTGQLPHDQPIVLYCIHSAHRAPLAAKTLQGLGFTQALVLEGGIVAWQAEGLTIRAADVAAAPKILANKERCEEAKRLYESSQAQ